MTGSSQGDLRGLVKRDLRRGLCILLLGAALLAACQRSPAGMPEVYVDAGNVRTLRGSEGALPDQLQVIVASGEEAAQLAQGAALYMEKCAPCHQPNGEGNLETFPALNRNAFVMLRQPAPVIETVLHGRQVMPAFAPTLDDAEVAAVISYIRNAWNNTASTVDAAQVADVRSEARAAQ